MPGLVPVDLLAQRADERPDVDFLVMDDARLTYGAVDELANRWASALADLGVGTGDSVAMLLENSLDTVLHGAGEETFDAVKMLKSADPGKYKAAPGANYSRGRFGDSLRQVAQSREFLSS